MLWRCLSPTSRLSVSIFTRLVHHKTKISLPYSDRTLVFNSEYNDPFINLAYENWMYENLDLEKHDILLFWRNVSCVVVGRHQNPWVECNLNELKENGVKLARRYSGGGTVYHDLGNLNITFLTHRRRYNRRRNLESIVKALREGWDFNVDISPRDDLVVDGLYKVSGSAAKLGKHSSYHHCTLLCDADLEKLKKAIAPRGFVTTTRSTQSVSSHVVNLKEIEPSVTMTEIITGVAKAYSQSSHHPQVLSLEMFKKYSSEIDRIKTDLQSWEWVFGKTAQFTVARSVLSSSGIKTTVNVDIMSGVIKNLSITPNIDPVQSETHLKEHLMGTRLISDDIHLAIDKYKQNCSSLLDERSKRHVEEILLCILSIV